MLMFTITVGGEKTLTWVAQERHANLWTKCACVYVRARVAKQWVHLLW